MVKSFRCSSILSLILLLSNVIRSLGAVGIPVIDNTNLLQTTVSAMENVNQTLKQIEQYRTQLQQYEDQVRNTAAPTAYLWYQADQAMTRSLNLTDSFKYYRQQAGSLNNYLQRYKRLNFYKNSPCFGRHGCSSQELKKLQQSEIIGNNAQHQANAQLVKGLDHQQQQIKSDAQHLDQLQHQAQQARGRMAAIQATNQLSAHQGAQLLEIRSLMVAQHNAQAARAQTIAAREARHLAAHEAALRGTFKKSTPVNYLNY